MVGRDAPGGARSAWQAAAQQACMAAQRRPPRLASCPCARRPRPVAPRCRPVAQAWRRRAQQAREGVSRNSDRPCATRRVAPTVRKRTATYLGGTCTGINHSRAHCRRARNQPAAMLLRAPGAAAATSGRQSLSRGAIPGVPCARAAAAPAGRRARLVRTAAAGSTPRGDGDDDEREALARAAATLERLYLQREAHVDTASDLRQRIRDAVDGVRSPRRA